MENSSNIKTNNIHLPSEIVIEIISYLDNIEDLKNCLLVSKEIRDLIFKTPQIIKSINFKVDTNFPDAYDFVCERGIYIRCFEFVSNIITFAVIEAFLCQMPNLEKLLITERINMNSEVQNKEVLRKSSKNHVKNLKSVNKLKDIVLDFYECDDSEAITKLVCQQNDLQELYVAHENFPSRDINAEVNFKLNTLTIYNNRDNLLPFLQNQADYLQSFTYYDIQTVNLCELIFGKMKKLEKLIFGLPDEYEYDDELESCMYTVINPEWKLESLKYFMEEDDCAEVKNLSNKFPNLEHLTCNHFAPGYETYSNLIILDISQFTCSKFHDAKFPKLKIVKISRMVGLKIMDFKFWKNFIRNSPNLENIQIDGIYHRQKSTFSFIISQIIRLSNLKSFKIRVNYSRGYELLSEEEEFNSRKAYYLIWINTIEKTIKISYYIARNPECKKIYKFLKENFEDFKFNNFEDESDAESSTSAAKIMKLG